MKAGPDPGEGHKPPGRLDGAPPERPGPRADGHCQQDERDGLGALSEARVGSEPADERRDGGHEDSRPHPACGVEGHEQHHVQYRVEPGDAGQATGTVGRCHDEVGEPVDLDPLVRGEVAERVRGDDLPSGPHVCPDRTCQKASGSSTPCSFNRRMSMGTMATTTKATRMGAGTRARSTARCWVVTSSCTRCPYSRAATVVDLGWPPHSLPSRSRDSGADREGRAVTVPRVPCVRRAEGERRPRPNGRCHPPFGPRRSAPSVHVGGAGRLAACAVQMRTTHQTERLHSMTKALVKLQSTITSMRSEKGATAVEYGLMVALIAVVIIVAVVALGTEPQHRLQQRREQDLTRQGTGEGAGAPGYCRRRRLRRCRGGSARQETCRARPGVHSGQHRLPNL